MADPRSQTLAEMADKEGYPEHAKLHRLEGKNETVGDFIEWCKGQGLLLMRWDESDDAPEGGYWHQDVRSTQALIAAHFGIDEQALDREKKDMLKRLRGVNA